MSAQESDREQFAILVKLLPLLQLTAKERLQVGRIVIAAMQRVDAGEFPDDPTDGTE